MDAAEDLVGGVPRERDPAVDGLGQVGADAGPGAAGVGEAAVFATAAGGSALESRALRIDSTALATSSFVAASSWKRMTMGAATFVGSGSLRSLGPTEGEGSPIPRPIAAMASVIFIR
ncbi:hypothetical protein [Singulisphaera sp. PoT]|uniref:hypothetical protein n=1 Tax=Singulisphaera sp. PoT TaxID=3411797 RepID=UPI003BF5EF50